MTPRMSLKVWNAGSDPYDHEQLADNFLKLDIHDHSQGRGTQIPSAGIVDGAITVQKANLPTYHVADTYANRPVAASSLNGVRFFATDKLVEWQCVGGVWVVIGSYAPEVTSLPTSPIDQQECIYLADATNGIKWRLRYRAASSSAYKWEVLGGNPIYNDLLPASSGTPPSSYGDLGGGIGPQITLPLAGDYLVSHGASLVAGASTISHRIYQSFSVGATAAIDNDSVSVFTFTNSVPQSSSVSRTVRKTGLAANIALTCKYYSTSPVAGDNASLRYIQATPVRVG